MSSSPSLVVEIITKLKAYVGGQVLIAALLSVFYMLGLWLIGFPAPIAMGLFLGASVFVPLFGPLVAFAVCVIVSFFYWTGWLDFGYLIGIFLVGQIIEGNFLTPALIGKKTGFHPAVIFILILCGGALMGPLGMILAVPVAIVAWVIMKRVMFVPALDADDVKKENKEIK